MTTKPTRGAQLGFGANAYASIGVAGFLALLPATAGVVPLIGALGGLDSNAGGGSSLIAEVFGGFVAFSIIIVPWLVPCLVLRARQPKGARIDWDEHEIVEWNGTWKRTAIRWGNAEAARLEWPDTRYRSRSRLAVQVLDKTNPESVITAWDEEPDEIPVLRRRFETSVREAQDLDSAVRAHCEYSRQFEMERIVDRDRPVQSRRIRNFTRLGYVGGLFGPLLAGPTPAIGVVISVVGTLLLAWRAAPAFRELARVRARLNAASQDADELTAWRYRFRSVLAEASVRAMFVILPLVGSISMACQ